MNSGLIDTEALQTVRDFIRYGISLCTYYGAYFGHGTDNASDDMHALILGSLALPYDEADLWLDARLSSDEKIFLTEQLKKRMLEKVPTAYLIKQAVFCGVPFFVDERVLIPRSPIAELIERSFEPWIDATKVRRILELCTGSGCIAIACHYAFPRATIHATDLSFDALEVANFNKAQQGIDHAVEFIHSDLFEQVPAETYDLIIANPPYVGDLEMQTLPREYTHEPDMALRAKDDGLYIVDLILKQAHHFLNETGVLVVEVGNTELLLSQKYPDLPFTWLTFERGGEGVFLLTRESLVSYFERRV